MEHFQIFISYRRDGGDAVAGRLTDRLRSLGYHVFLDVQSMHSGKFDEQICEAIEQCSDMILILSPGALERCVSKDDWIRQELSFALRHRKNIIPIILDNFKYPIQLPQDIDQIRLFESVVYSNIYFEAMMERIRELLLSGVNIAPNYALESQEYYKIRTPLVNIYKQHHNTPRSYMNVAVFIEKHLLSDQPGFHWTAYSSKDPSIRSLSDYFARFKHDSVIAWYDANRKRIAGLREQVITMKGYSDPYFYVQALLFSIGSLFSLPDEILNIHPDTIVETFCYCMDLPRDMFEDLVNAFNEGNHGFREFRDHLPLAFDIWPAYHKGERANSDHQRNFDSFACLLFDFMVDLSMLILDSCKNSNLTLIRTGQIRSYYKWLRKNKLYLPKGVQEKIYHYL